MEKNVSYWIVYVGIVIGIAGTAGVSHYLNQRKFIKVPIAQRKPEILRETEQVSEKNSDVEEFVERRRQRAAEKRNREMHQGEAAL